MNLSSKPFAMAGIRKTFLAMASLLASCAAPTTSVRLQLQYDESWPLSSFVVQARDRMVRVHSSASDGTKTRELIVTVANEWAGESIVYSVQAFSGTPGREELFASGQAMITAVEGETVDADIVFARTACAAWCTLGSKSCSHGGVATCELTDTGCPGWGEPQLCSDGQSCSLGECRAECVNECVQGETRCAGPLGVQVCGQSDDDPCLDWQEPMLCERTQVCSNGRCADSCTSECTAGSVRCRDGGVSTCSDLNDDGCLEWGPSVACAAEQSCAGIEGLPGAEGIAQCEAPLCPQNDTTCNSACHGTDCAEAVTPQIGAGEYHTCALRRDGSVSCWGSGANRIGNGADSARAPVAVLGLTQVRALSVGWRHNCAVLQNGSARCWGWGVYGQLGDGGTDSRSTPVSVTGLSNVARIASGWNHTCALLQDGSVRCWGLGAEGQLGNGRVSQGYYETTPVAVSNLPRATAIAAGFDHTCALLQDRTVRCWGRGHYGRLGDGSGANQSTAVAVADLTSVTGIAAGKYHTCALLEGGSVRCWGAGDYGQLGSGGTPEASLTPGAVVGLADATAIATGSEHTCAVLRDGSARCWGWGRDGELGNGRVGAVNARELTPVSVSDISTASQIAVGDSHSCALLRDGAARCWGLGHVGQLGNGRDGEGYREGTPVAVTGLP